MLLNRERAVDVMDRHNLDGLVAALPENVYYLSDYGASHSFSLSLVGVSAAILPRNEDLPPTLIVCDFEVPHLSDFPTWMPDVRMMEGLRSRISADLELSQGEQEVCRMWEALQAKGPSPHRQELISRVLAEMGLSAGRLGFDDLRVLGDVSTHLPELIGVEAVNVFREIKIIKTPAEVAILRRAAQINEAALSALVAAATEGTTMRELRRVWFTAMAAQGATGVELPLGGCDRPWHLHGDTSYALRTGDVLCVDVAGTFERYWTDTGRTVHVGSPSSKLEELFGALEDCHRAVVPMLRPGTDTAEIAEAAVEAVGTRMPEGFAPVVHSIGNELYDQPSTYGSLYSDSFALEVGMVVNFESIYFEYPWGALQLENTYYLGPDGTERLTALPNGPLRAAGS